MRWASFHIYSAPVALIPKTTKNQKKFKTPALFAIKYNKKLQDLWRSKNIFPTIKARNKNKNALLAIGNTFLAKLTSRKPESLEKEAWRGCCPHHSSVWQSDAFKEVRLAMLFSKFIKNNNIINCIYIYDNYYLFKIQIYLLNIKSYI